MLDFAGLAYVTASLERLILYLNPTLVLALGFGATQSDAVGMSLLSYRPNDKEDGYFMLLASPELKSAQTKRTCPSAGFGRTSARSFRKARSLSAAQSRPTTSSCSSIRVTLRSASSK